GFVRNGFVLVAAPGQHRHVRLLADAAQEGIDERRLSDPRLAGDRGHDELAGAHALERVRERRELARAADEGARERTGLGVGDAGATGPRSEYLLELRAARTDTRVARKQAQANLLELGGRPRHEAARWIGRVKQLEREQLVNETPERKTADQRLVEHHADRVPIRC